MGIELFSKWIQENYEIYEWNHACAILKNDYTEEWNDLVDLLTQFRLKQSFITEPGGR